VSARADSILEIKVSLVGIRPPIWRRLQVPADDSFWDLHVAIQDTMGRLDFHLHEFRVVPGPRRRSLRIGIRGYEEFLRSIADPTHEEHESCLTWVGGRYDPEEFDPQAVRFSDPVTRWRIAFLGEAEDKQPRAPEGGGP